MAMAFFPLALWMGAAPPDRTLFYSTLATIFAFLGGSGFTAWLSMTIYEYITRESQKRGWKHEFDIDLVKEIYGPIHNRLRWVREILNVHFSGVKVGELALLHRQYLSILIPSKIIDMGGDFERLAGEYNESYNQVKGRLNELVRDAANSYLADLGGPSGAIDSMRGGEARYILGATHPALKSAYQELLQKVMKVCTESGLDGKTSELEARLKEVLLSEPAAQEFLAKRKRLSNLARAIIAQIEPHIKGPHEL